MQDGLWITKPYGRREWVWHCGCRAKTPTSFWVNSCEAHSLRNK